RFILALRRACFACVTHGSRDAVQRADHGRCLRKSRPVGTPRYRRPWRGVDDGARLHAPRHVDFLAGTTWSLAAPGGLSAVLSKFLGFLAKPIEKHGQSTLGQYRSELTSLGSEFADRAVRVDIDDPPATIAFAQSIIERDGFVALERQLRVNDDGAAAAV